MVTRPLSARPIPDVPRQGDGGPAGGRTGPDGGGRSSGDVASWIGRAFLAVVLVPLLVVGAGTLFGAGIAPAGPPTARFVESVESQLLDFPPLDVVLNDANQDQRSVVVDNEGNELAILRAVNRVVVPLSDVPLDVQNAVLATEDELFREHQGVNWQSIARAAIGNLSAGEITSGASTITQQLVKLLTGQDDITVQRKLQEAVYAIQLEQQYTKDQILEFYLNEVYFGNGVYGIGTAAEYYFSKDVGQLTVGEAALLAGIIRAPSANEPVGHLENSRERRDIVLEQMVEAGFITQFEADEAIREPVRLNVQEIEEPDEPFFVSYVRTLLRDMEALGADAASRERTVLRGGITIETTLDPQIQQIAEESIRTVLEDVDGPQSALTAVQPGTGRILAIGFGPKEFGQGPGQTEVLPAVPGVGSSFGRQPGSSFKPFELVAALEAGVPPGYTIDTPSPYRPTRHCTGSGWAPGNYSDGGGGIMNMAAATARSSNVYFAHLVDEFTGPEGLADSATRMGIVNTDLYDPLVCSAVLGGREVYPLDMASAFGTLANRGNYCPPFAIERILDRDGNPIFEADPDADCRRAVSEDHANLVTSFLRGPIENGTASRNGQIGRPAAGKTGTTDDWKDAWFVGFIPQLSSAVWVGNEVPSSMSDPRCGNVTGGCLPTMIWADFMQRAIAEQGYPVVEFPPAPRFPANQVPSVVGLMQDEAEAILADAEFLPVSSSVVDFRPAGTVIAQKPPGGSEAPSGAQVLLSVSDGTGEAPVVPSLVGLTVEEAQALLADSGIALRVVEVPVDDPAQLGRIIAQSPAAGEIVLTVAGTTPDSPGIGEIVVEVGRERQPGDPTAEPTATATPTVEPTTSPSPTVAPSARPTDEEPPDEPTAEPTDQPSGEASDEPPDPNPRPTDDD